MIGELKVVVIMPAYNAARTLEKTYTEIPHDIVDEVVLVDDDNTICVARRIGITHIVAHGKIEVTEEITKLAIDMRLNYMQILLLCCILTTSTLQDLL